MLPDKDELEASAKTCVQLAEHIRETEPGATNSILYLHQAVDELLSFTIVEDED